MTIVTAPDVATLRRALAGWRRAGERIALVPTMGALHEGHLALVRLARAECERVVVSIFVNPTQFAPNEDFSAYPRTLDEDLAKLAGLADLVFTPAADEMYPPGSATTASVAGPATVGLEDRFRPTHFAGVATVVAKLLVQALPDVATFGEKDFQQLK
ncbi:MAG TPA: pantoate--beta-alanine ligase, partial [Beijerinckiaceae bacterium]|nr:pantoate--beta-alanine ligase [Beijerinckiaceae bacterium]